MIEFNNPDGFGRSASEPVGDDWSEGEKKLKRGNRSEIIAVLNLVLVAAVVGVFWYLDRESSSKWQKELDAAAEAAVGSTLGSTGSTTASTRGELAAHVQHGQHHQRPHQIELLFDGQAPGVGERGDGPRGHEVVA